MRADLQRGLGKRSQSGRENGPQHTLCRSPCSASDDLLLFHAVAERKASAADLRLASLLIWGRSALLRASEEEETPQQAEALLELGMWKLANVLAGQLENQAGRSMLESALHKLENIIVEVEALPLPSVESSPCRPGYL